MKWKIKWIIAIVLTIAVITVAKLEQVGWVDKPLTQYVTTGKDFIVMKQWLASMFDSKEADTITVSADPVEELPFASYQSMQPYKNGVIASYTQAMPIEAHGEGLIVFTGFTRQSGKTVTVLYESGDEVTYGFVGSFSKLPYTTVQKGDTVAMMHEETLYLEVRREGMVLDAAKLATYFSEPAQ